MGVKEGREDALNDTLTTVALITIPGFLGGIDRTELVHRDHGEVIRVLEVGTKTVGSALTLHLVGRGDAPTAIDLRIPMRTEPKSRVRKVDDGGVS